MDQKQRTSFHVSILGLGPSLSTYVDIAKRLGGRHAYCDEVWGINAVGGVVAVDRVFHMDDVAVQEIRAASLPESNIARMLEWMRTTNIPIVTSTVRPGYPTLEAFPLEAVINQFQQGYFNSTAAYAVAYALFRGVTHLSIFGCDYTYPDAHDAERGRACLEFWLGLAAAAGVRITIPKTSTLMDAIYVQPERFYGYDGVHLALKRDPSGLIRVESEPRETLPTAEEIEARYDHTAHPNPLVPNSGASGPHSTISQIKSSIGGN